ncbi:TetR/AcrR family transcriptional regulator [Aquibium microcysteis]|uniref:TetR/AcrR family transcriptional regulator n=1 Tax=Aquibium microcysteis TaxID=675281 RepID=UPI00165D1C40|nr:TetR/AcrR family transcriptional regulator [Aquibium microcysteis]
MELTRQRREDILREAANLFDQVGYHGVNMEMIAEAAGLKKPTLYHYVKGKDEILYMMQKAVIVGVRQGIDDRAAAGEPPLNLLRGVYEDIFRQLNEAPGTIRSFFEHGRELRAEHQADIRKERDAFNRVVVKIISEGMASGLIARADPRLTALCFFGVVNWAYQWYNPVRDGDPETVATKCFDIFSRGMVSNPSA